MSYSKLKEQYLTMQRDYRQGKYEPTEHGFDNEEMEHETGYCQAVSGLMDMSIKDDKMLEAEARFWRRFRINNPDTWKAQLSRLKHTRGTIFTDRLLKCIKWLERRKNNLSTWW